MEKEITLIGHRDDDITQRSNSAFLLNDPALKAYLSKTVTNDSEAFVDYPVTPAFVRAGIIDTLKVLGISNTNFVNAPLPE